MRARKEQKKSQKGAKIARQEETGTIEKKGRQQEKRSLPESQKDKRKKVSGLVRKHLPEIEKRLVEGDTRDIILDWIRAETGMDIPRTTFIKALYRARQWAKTAKPIEAYDASPIPPPTMRPKALTPSKPQPLQQVSAKKKEEKPGLSEPEKTSNPLSDWKARKAAMESADPIEIIKKLQEEGKIQS